MAKMKPKPAPATKSSPLKRNVKFIKKSDPSLADLITGERARKAKFEIIAGNKRATNVKALTKKKRKK